MLPEMVMQKPRATARFLGGLSIFLFLLCPLPSPAQLTTLRVGTNSPASTESVLFSIAKDAGILKQSQLDVEVIFIAGGTLSMQALIGKSLDFLCTGGTPFIVAYLEGAQGRDYRRSQQSIALWIRNSRKHNLSRTAQRQENRHQSFRQYR
jgi:ABC-type nitrate/sulfonate/bicarbonate transport system substrate-binding protein